MSFELAVLIMAGGRGTRLWPWSRRSRPKQLLSLTGNATILEDTVRRVALLTPASRIFVIADADIVSSARRLLPDIPPPNFVLEVSPRSTWPSCVLGTAVISHVVAEDAAVLVLPADHAVRDEESFGCVLTTGLSRVREGGFVTFGVTPTRPETGYGYIRRGEILAAGPPAVHRGLSFHEKPTPDRAAAYVAAGDYAWNSGMFGWRADVFFSAACLLYTSPSPRDS